MERYRLNMQINGMMQHVIFPDSDSAMAALRKIFVYQSKGPSGMLELNGSAMVDPTAVSFADVRKA